MDDIEINLMENTIYEVIITSFNKQVNFKPFGIKFNNKKVILNLYPNRTLKNIKTNHLHYLYHLYYSPDIMQ